MWLLLASPSGVSIGDTLSSFGIAAPVIGILVWLLIRAEKGRADAEAARTADMQKMLPVLERVTETMASMTSAVDGWTEEQKRERWHRGGS